MDIISKFFNQQQEIYDYFGFVEDWVVLPFDDRRGFAWKLTGSEVSFGRREDIINDTGNQYVDSIYKQRFYDKWVYVGEDYTMVMVDTQTDGNRFLAIFDNDRRITQ
ncbi:hypothetical protein [Aquibacillus saliphilus]|uniref:hypothetical protein n=1 Tax=Aquibacillus saliphilus TaxID=1909422 RepID=UPI001CF002CB|nr:hypothetical protein [Aquibacillus saliphilus]